ncbi:DUF6538 domain-containing protein [Kaistia algarum]|uniref:DUF6538 domain-containing protein n=1 Tax=Kaistia algarum TaxID=2083279 RepID=UPI000CE827B5|nr:DUF6538 domain-containing protein [Kaistia algarum]MCX5512300.1 tyrosine-type recombinase/integrase [Kaistia algarum]
MKAPPYAKLRGNVFWFQIGVPIALQAHYGKVSIQENLRTSDRYVAAHLADERKVHWKREFRLWSGKDSASTPRAVYQETLRQVEWISENYRDKDDRDMHLDLLWDSVANPEARRLGLVDISEATGDEVVPAVDAALTAIKNAREGTPMPSRFKIPFSEISARFNLDRQRDSRAKLSDQTISQREAVYRLFRDHINDAPLATVDARKSADFFDKVKRLHPHWGRSPQTKSRSFAYILALSETMEGERISGRTVTRFASDLGALWDWAVKQGEVIGANPFSGHRVESKTRKGANAPWSNAALRKLLASEVSAGIKGRPDPLYWLPRIALLSGLRLNEICALEAVNLCEVDGVRYFDITAGKTDSSVRVVPIHHALQPLLELAPADGYLFPDLKPSKLDGKRGAAIGKVLGRRFKSIAGGSTFHAFRKNVAQTFERSRIPESEAAQILGHKKTGMTYGVYSPNGLEIGQKRDLVELLSLGE